MELGEALGTVAALEQEGLAARDAGELGGELARLAGEDERRIVGELRRGGVQRSLVGVIGELAGLGLGPAVGGPAHGLLQVADMDVPVLVVGDAVGGDLVEHGGGGALAVLLPALDCGARGVEPGAESGAGKGAFLTEAADLGTCERRHDAGALPPWGK